MFVVNPSVYLWCRKNNEFAKRKQEGGKSAKGKGKRKMEKGKGPQLFRNFTSKKRKNEPIFRNNYAEKGKVIVEKGKVSVFFEKNRKISKFKTGKET